MSDYFDEFKIGLDNAYKVVQTVWKLFEGQVSKSQLALNPDICSSNISWTGPPHNTFEGIITVDDEILKFSEAARKKMVKQGQAEGLRPAEENGQSVWYTKGGLRGKTSSKLLEMQKEYEDLPGFAEGVAKAVAEGMNGVAQSIGTSVGNAINGWSPQINLPEIKIPDFKIPGMDALADAMKKLNEMLGKFIQDPRGYLANPTVGRLKKIRSILKSRKANPNKTKAPRSHQNTLLALRSSQAAYSLAGSTRQRRSYLKR